LYKEGYTTTWEITVFNEDGDEITTGDLNEYDGPPPWRGSEFVEITWLPPQDLDPQELTFELKITRCTPKPDVQILGQGEPPGEKCTPKTVRGVLALGNIPELALILSDSLAFGKLEITSSDKLTRAQLNAKRILSQNQKIELRKLGADSIPDGLNSINVSFDMSKSFNPEIFEGAEPVPIPLSYESGASKAGPFVFSAEFYPHFYEEHDSGNLKKRGFTVIDASAGGFFESALVQGFISDKNVLLGRSEVNGDPTKIVEADFPPSDDDNVVETSRSAFLKAGFEVIDIRADDPAAPKLAEAKLNLRFRLQNQAPLVFYRGRIRQPENVMELGTGSLNALTSIDALDEWEQVRTVILTSSDALNLGNLGNTILGEQTVEAANSGRPWAYGMMWRGVERVLGYNYRAPQDLGAGSVETRALKKFLYLLDTRFYRNNSAGLDETALAWIYGHISTPIAEPIDQDPNNLGPARVTSAAAFTRRHYLFVLQHDLPGIPKRRFSHKKRSVLAVPLELWENQLGINTLLPVTRPGVAPPLTIRQAFTQQFRPALVDLNNVYRTSGVRRIDEF
jgi:hypothetical protein